MTCLGWFYVALASLETLLSVLGPWALERVVLTDIPYFLLLFVHLLAGLRMLPPVARHFRRPVPEERCRWWSEELLVATLILSVFAAIYALNANMDYVQRFMASGGAVRLALDTRRERLLTLLRFGPLLLLNLLVYLRLKPLPAATPEGTVHAGPGPAPERTRLADPGPAPERTVHADPGPAPERTRLADPVDRWALVWVLLSVLLALAAFPSFLNLRGFASAAWFALVPLLLVLERVGKIGFRRALFYALSFGVLQGMLLNFWLGTFSLITLQLVTIFLLLAYALFFAAALWLYSRLGRLRWLVFPLAWILFEYLRSSGFLGYPWGLWGTTQYRFTSLIQIAAVTGVWGVSFLVLLVNSVLAETAAALIRARRPRSSAETDRARRTWSGAETDKARRPWSGAETDKACRPRWKLLAATLLVAAACAAAGFLSLSSRDSLPAERRVRVALIQQNSDPRKHDYRRTLDTLKFLTGEALKRNPELVVWSETAFVPNIRRWSGYDPDHYPLAALVHEFLDFQRGLGTWLMTGNDDYELVETKEGGQERLDYNAAILFSPAGERTATYHKIHLVPFTEYFPWKRQLPGFYRLLLTFDVYLWEPGSERVIFNHPGFRFATPICFEDAFPDDVRRFVRAGAEAIVNLSNDFWSLTEVEAQQHFVNALFRAVENRRPLLRATASGVTAYVDDRGRTRALLPFYQEGQLTVDVVFRQSPPDTFYTRLGDWFPRLAGVLLALLAVAVCIPCLRKRL